MRIAENRFLSAIELGKLQAPIVNGANGPAISIMVDGAEFIQLECNPSGRPTANVVANGQIVELLPTRGIKGGVMIRCNSPDKAKRIAEAIDRLLATAYSKVVF